MTIAEHDLTDGLISSQGVVIIVIPRDRFSIFPRCLEALYAHTQMPFRLIVVAGGTDGTTKEYLHQLRAQKSNINIILVNRLLRQSEARNIALPQVYERFASF